MKDIPSRVSLCLFLAAWTLVSACSPVPETVNGFGFVQVQGALQQALGAEEVTEVRLTISAVDMPTRTVPLAKTGGRWGGVIGQLPAGTGRTFSAVALDASGSSLFEGETTGVTILAGQTVVVALTLQQVEPPPSYGNAVPCITSLTATPSSVAPGETVSLQATAKDLDEGDTLTYAWTAAAGSFTSDSSPSTTWMAPATTGPVTLTLTVVDSQGAEATLSVTLTVRSAQGSAAVDASLNTWPQVASMTASPSAVEVGQPTTVDTSATDNDGDSLSYAWASSCEGTWSDANSPTATFTPSLAPEGDTCANCALTVTVTDGRGGSTTGTLSICVGATPSASFPPEIVETFQSSLSTGAEGVVALRLGAMDPQGSALTFSWAASTGTLAAPTSGAGSSEVSWTAPTCTPEGAATTITATVTNGLGLSASHSFQVGGLPACATSSAWLEIEAGSSHTVALKADGTVWAWGGIIYDKTPLQVPGLSDVTSVATGQYHSVALKEDGTVWTWGSNDFGELGDGTTIDRSTPAQVPGLSGVTAIAAGGRYTMALKSDGTLWAWGYNSYGSLGTAASVMFLTTPSQVLNLSDVTRIAAGWHHRVALKGDGTLWTWGANWKGQLGDGTTSLSYTPVQVLGLSDITAVVSGADSNNTFAWRSDGTLWAWGDNASGQLGDGTTTDRSTPAQLQSLSNVTAINAGGSHTVALKADGTVWAWGNNENGQLGDGTTTSRPTPARIEGLSDVTALGAGDRHSLSLKGDGTVWAWGYNGNGQLGDGTITSRPTPVQVQGL